MNSTAPRHDHTARHRAERFEIHHDVLHRFLRRRLLFEACHSRTEPRQCRRHWRDGSRMTRANLIAELGASHPHLRPSDVELIVTTVFDQIAQALAKGDRVELRGFGTFITKQRDAWSGRNPRTGEEVPVDAKLRPSFRAGRRLLGRLNRRAG